MVSVRAFWLARQQQLLEPRSLVLEPGRGAPPGRRKPLGVPVASTGSPALGRPGRKNMATGRCAQRHAIRARWLTDTLNRPVCGFARVALSLPALPIDPERRVKKFYRCSVQ